MKLSEYIAEQLEAEYGIHLNLCRLSVLSNVDELAVQIAEDSNNKMNFSDMDIALQEYVESYCSYCDENDINAESDIVGLEVD